MTAAEMIVYIRTEYAYDTMDRVTNISWKTSSGGTSLGGFDYEYVAVGRIVSRSHALGTNAFDRAYAYDDLDRLSSDGGVSYTYDAAGNRTAKTENGETFTYSLGAGGVGGLLYLTVDGVIYIPCYDNNCNIMGYWDAQGNVVAEYTYDAFGKLILSSGPMADAFAIRYSTKYFDVETGFYYYGYRFYSPELMRWITRDPIGEEGGVNLYAFCENGSTFLIDATGLTKYWDKYMKFEAYTSGDVWKQVGGNLYWGYLSGTYRNSCALRVSRTLILNGHSPKKGEHRNVNKDYVTLKEIVISDDVVIPKGTKLKAESNGKRYVISAHAIGSLLDECLTDPTVKKLKWRSEEEAKKLRACIEKENGEAFFVANGHAGMIKKGYTDANFPYKPTGRIWRIK